MAADTAIVRVTDDTSADELREAITNLSATAARLPAHWTDRKAVLHGRIDALLYELDIAIALGR